MKVEGQGLTLTSLMQASEGTSNSKKLLSNNGTEVHTHGWKLHRLGDSAQQQRLQKAENGANMVKAALNREFGHISPDFADSVFQAINLKHGKDLSSSITVGDLKLVKQEADHLMSLRDKIGVVAERNSGYSLSQKVTGELVQDLVGALADPNTPAELKDVGIKALGKLISKNSDNAKGMAEILGTPKKDDIGRFETLKPEVLNALFSLTDSQGDPILSDTELRKVTVTLVREEAASAAVGGGGILRSNSLASRVLTIAYSQLDNGALPRLGQDLVNLIKTSNDTDTVLKGLDGLLKNASQSDMTELKQLFTEVESAIDETNLKNNADQKDPTILKKNQLSGSDFVLNSVILRVVNPTVISQIKDIPVEKRGQAVETTKVLQQATAPSINFGDAMEKSTAFKNDSDGLRDFHNALLN